MIEQSSSDLERRNRLITEHRGLALSAAAALLGFVGRGRTLDELASAGMIGLIEAASKWDPRRGPRTFEEFARTAIRRAIINDGRQDLIDRHRRRDADGDKLPSRLRAEQYPPSYRFDQPDHAPRADDALIAADDARIAAERADSLAAAIAKLPAAERGAIRCKLEGLTQAQTGARLKVHQTTARSIQLRAMAKLKMALAA